MQTMMLPILHYQISHKYWPTFHFLVFLFLSLRVFSFFSPFFLLSSINDGRISESYSKLNKKLKRHSVSSKGIKNPKLSDFSKSKKKKICFYLRNVWKVLLSLKFLNCLFTVNKWNKRKGFLNRIFDVPKLSQQFFSFPFAALFFLLILSKICTFAHTWTSKNSLFKIFEI